MAAAAEMDREFGHANISTPSRYLSVTSTELPGYGASSQPAALGLTLGWLASLRQASHLRPPLPQVMPAVATVGHLRTRSEPRGSASAHQRQRLARNDHGCGPPHGSPGLRGLQAYMADLECSLVRVSVRG